MTLSPQAAPRRWSSSQPQPDSPPLRDFSIASELWALLGAGRAYLEFQLIQMDGI